MKKKNNKKKIEEKEEQGLGDMVKKAIEVVAPKLAEEKEDCPDCNKRREILNKAGEYLKNNFNAVFSNNSKQ